MSGTRAMKRGRSALPAIGIALVASLFAMCVLMLGHALGAHADHAQAPSTLSAASSSAVAGDAHAHASHEDRGATGAAPVAATIVTAAATAAATVAVQAAVIAAATTAPLGLSHGGMHGSMHSGGADGAMMLMVCAMALLTAVVLLLAPRLLRGLRLLLPVLRARVLAVAARLPQARPPSLIVLSISRT